MIISTYTVGKEELLLNLSDHFQTRIIVEEKRFKTLELMNFSMHKFSVDLKDGWLHASSRQASEEEMKNNVKNLYIIPTGWINCKDYIKRLSNCYMFPYSSHSNFFELEEFVKFIKPCKLTPIVDRQGGSSRLKSSIKTLNEYMMAMFHLKHRGLDYLKRKYVRSN